MRRSAAVGLIAVLLMALTPLAVMAQESREGPPTTTRAPIRPFDPPLPEPLLIPDLVSDLVVTEVGVGLEVSPLTANPPAPAPGSGLAIDWLAWAEFAVPALIPLVLALLLLALTRIPRRPSDSARSDVAG